MASISMAAWASYWTVWRMPMRAEAASKRRPMLLVGTQRKFFRSCWASTSSSLVGTAETQGRSGCQGISAAHKWARAMR